MKKVLKMEIIIQIILLKNLERRIQLIISADIENQINQFIERRKKELI